MRGQREHALDIGRLGPHQRVPALVHTHIGVLVIVESRAAHARILERKTERLHEMQLCTRVRAQPDDVAGVGRNLGLDEDDVEHAGER